MLVKTLYSLCLFTLMTSFSFASGNSLDHCFRGQSFPAFANEGFLQKLARGVNLPNWDADEIEFRPDLDTLAKLYARGFKHVRLPVYHTAFTDGDFGSADLADYMISLRSMVDSLTGIGYAVTVDFHPDGAFNHTYRTQPETGYRRLEDSWHYLASGLRDTSHKSVAVEFLNEPDTTPKTWQDHAQRLSRKMREWLPYHTFIVGPAGPMRHERLADFQPLKDDNTIYAVHFYDPFIFTHQGAEWHAPDDPVRLSVGVPFPSRENDPRIDELIARLTAKGHLEAAKKVGEIFQEPWTIKDIENAFTTVWQWSQKHGLPVIVNEFGVLSYDAPRDDRLFWLDTVVTEAEQRCIGWTHWDYSDGFGIIDPMTNEPDIEALNVLIKPTDLTDPQNQ
jgi:endoglucanase